MFMEKIEEKTRLRGSSPCKESFARSPWICQIYDMIQIYIGVVNLFTNTILFPNSQMHLFVATFG